MSPARTLLIAANRFRLYLLLLRLRRLLLRLLRLLVLLSLLLSLLLPPPLLLLGQQLRMLPLSWPGLMAPPCTVGVGSIPVCAGSIGLYWMCFKTKP